MYTLQAEPFLYLNDAVLDFGLRVTLIIFLCIGAGIASDIIESHAADAVLLAIGASGALAVLLSGDAIGAVLQTVGRTVTLVDDRASDFLFCQVCKQYVQCAQHVHYTQDTSSKPQFLDTEQATPAIRDLLDPHKLVLTAE